MKVIHVSHLEKPGVSLIPIEEPEVEMSIGRDASCDIVFGDDDISRTHATLRIGPTRTRLLNRSKTQNVEVDGYVLGPEEETDVQWGALFNHHFVSVVDTRVDRIASIGLSPRGDMFLVGFVSGRVELRDVSHHRLLRCFYVPSAATGVRFGLAGKRIIATHDLGGCTVWETSTGRPVAALGVPKRYLADAVMSPDGTAVALVGLDPRVQLHLEAVVMPIHPARGHTRNMVWSATHAKSGHHGCRGFVRVVDGNNRLIFEDTELDAVGRVTFSEEGDAIGIFGAMLDNGSMYGITSHDETRVVNHETGTPEPRRPRSFVDGSSVGDDGTAHPAIDHAGEGIWAFCAARRALVQRDSDMVIVDYGASEEVRRLGAISPERAALSDDGQVLLVMTREQTLQAWLQDSGRRPAWTWAPSSG